MKITVDELYRLLNTEGKFFSVTFERRTDSRRRVQLAGDIRTMLCRTGMAKYKKGLVSDQARAEEDFRCAVLTVWDVNAFLRYRKRGMAEFAAGCQSWRRIDLCGVRELSLVDADRLPPTIHNEYHQITNPYRVANMPTSA